MRWGELQKNLLLSPGILEEIVKGFNQVTHTHTHQIFCRFQEFTAYFSNYCCPEKPFEILKGQLRYLWRERLYPPVLKPVLKSQGLLLYSMILKCRILLGEKQPFKGGKTRSGNETSQNNSKIKYTEVWPKSARV